MKKWFRKIIISLLILLMAIAITALIILSDAKFGQPPQGEQLETIEHSPNYANGQFRNLVPTQKLTTNSSSLSIMWHDFFYGNKETVPNHNLPAIKTDLKALDSKDDLVIWLGHSSYYIQLGGKRILIDPILGDYAAPFSFLNKAFSGTTLYTADDIPEIDYLLISHDHWDHLDYPTVTSLYSKIGKAIVPLGVGSHLRYWGYPENQIMEADWNSKLTLADDFTLYVLPARHYSGRLFKENETLWASFALEANNRKLYFSGDSGYGPHFKQIADLINGFDLVLLDSGQYDTRWADIHMNPEQAVLAAKDLQTKALMPAHVGRFSISNHSWYEPFKRIVDDSQDAEFALFTPIIGQPVWLNGRMQHFTNWWE